MNKYNAKKVVYQGIKFDSQHEAQRYAELNLLLMAGKIAYLKRQVKYVLIPKQVENGKVVEREVSYIADFVYYDTDKGQLVVEDAKGYKGGQAYSIFKIKRKLMLERYGIKIKET